MENVENSLIKVYKGGPLSSSGEFKIVMPSGEEKRWKIRICVVVGWVKQTILRWIAHKIGFG